MADTVRLAVALPNPIPRAPLPESAFPIYIGVWVPLLFVEVAKDDRGELEKMFGADSVREMASVEFELSRGIDVCLTHAEHLLTRAPNGFVDRGGEGRAIEWSGYPVLDDAGQVRPSADLNYSTPQCHFVALNLSKQDEPIADPDPHGLVPIATRIAARQVLVIVAAGNDGERNDLADTRSPWARSEWVVAVGATEDRRGLRVAPYSGRGPTGPDLVAWGASGLDETRVGTSFAAPRVAREALVLAACLHTLAHAVGLELGGEPGGIPLVGEITVDVGRPGWPENQLPLPAYPLVGVNRPALADALRALGPAASDLRLVPEPALLGRALRRSARRSNADRPGFVARQTTLEYLTRLDGAELSELGVGTGRLDAKDPRLRVPLLGPDELESAINIWDRASLHLYYEHETEEITLN